MEDNCNLFDPRDIYTIARNIEGCLLGEDVEWLKNKIESAADSYDDDLLNWLILYLKGL